MAVNTFYQITAEQRTAQNNGQLSS